jgi:hypothetical protein
MQNKQAGQTEKQRNTTNDYLTTCQLTLIGTKTIG